MIVQLTCVQMHSTDDVARNHHQLISLLEASEFETGDQSDQTSAVDIKLIVLPEKWNVIGEPESLHGGAEVIDYSAAHGATSLSASIDLARTLATKYSSWVVAGSIVEKIEGDELLRNTSVLIDPNGSLVARYEKIHMFDVEVGGVVYRESECERRGNKVVVAGVNDGLKLGMTICYDLRFPELYRAIAMMGARIITVPAAFTQTTGRAHWEPLLRARAIENQCIVVAANQCGDHGGGKTSWGHSMIVDAWGRVLAEAGSEPQVISAFVDLADVDEIRERLPSLASCVPEVVKVEVA